MPDTTTTPSTQSEPPPAEDGWRPDLATLRLRLDEIDDKIHALLMDRARVVESVARSGKAAAFRPGREASILRRLLARHTGRLPPQTVVRMWREMLAGTTAMQTAVSVAVFDPGADATVTALAREHFGFLTPVFAHRSSEAALDAVRSGAAVVAVVPFPTEAAAWWPALTASRPRLYLNARLPYWAWRPRGVPKADVLVVGATAPDSSGDDRSFIVAERGGLSDAGFIVHATYGTVTEVEGMISEEDPRLPAGALVIGGYAVPVTGEPV